ncbi:MAG: DUF4172 domain-containing protein [Tannerella sp.]|jgi:Fic family protein|nr:DUF4172 domain-containing protein [Tannerella sp.]
MYNWQYKEWANFTYDKKLISEQTLDFMANIEATDTLFQGLSADEQQEEIIRSMISEAVKTSEIEGEYISRNDLMSSIKNKLGINKIPENVRNRRAVATANLLVSVRNANMDRLTEAQIKQWHQILFENSGTVKAGKYRTGETPMQIVSGAIGRETVHYEAPPSYRTAAEMKQFVKWYNSFIIKDKIDILIKTSVAHLYFESIHPFEDGNGRIGRAIAEKCIAQSLGKSVILSLSSVIEKNRSDYYNALKKAQSTLEITEWIVYFAQVIAEAQIQAADMVKFTLQKATFFDKFGKQINQRELKALEKMFEAGIEGFQGGMTASKYMNINRISKATATRDLQHLSEIGSLTEQSGGRSVHYLLNLPDSEMTDKL